MVRIGSSDLDIFPVQFGGNVFGWTVKEPEAADVLDAFVAGGGNAIDSADVYGTRQSGNEGGSEAVLGRWMAARKNRSQLIIATKVGMGADHPGASRQSIMAGVDASLARLQTDYIDLYYIHRDDPETPLEETIGALTDVVNAGKVRYIGASNYAPPRLEEALRLSEASGGARFVAVQPPYSLVRRDVYEGPLQEVIVDQGLGALTYSSLASGFLTGKYREGASVDSPRAENARKLLDDRGKRILAALDDVAAAHGTSNTAVALAWLRSRPGVAAPIASASSVEQVGPLLESATLDLGGAELDQLTAASA